MEEIKAFDFKQNWSQDPKGYFLIRINKESQVIEVAHCLKDNEILRVILGRNPEEIMYKIIEQELVSLLDHAAYLGKELQKAYSALKNHCEYSQDSELTIN
jgi:dihydropteroate synthase